MSKKRSRMRGAAMVEAAVIIPVLVVFYGVMMFVHNAHAKKIDVQSETRFRAFTNAAHACDGSGTPGKTGVVDDPAIPKEGDAPDDDKTRSLETTLFDTRANTTAVAVALQRSHRVSAKSKVYCNPFVVSTLQLPGRAAGVLEYYAPRVQAGMWKALKFAGYSINFVAQWTNGWINP